MNKYLGIILVFQAMVSVSATELSNACSCNDFVNENDFGKCKKTDSDFGGLVSCYVNLPTTCKDLVSSVRNPGKYLSAKACKNEKKKQFDKIIRGNEVRPKYKYPYQAFYAAGGYKCGGTIIGKRHVITADHCIKGRRPTRDTFVIVGEHRVTSNAAYGDRPEAIFGSNLIRVKRFIRRSGRNREDIGILELARDIRWSNRIQPACIPVRGAGDYVGRDAVVSGFGGTVQYNPGQNVYQVGSEVLLETTLKVLSPRSALCKKAFGSAAYKLCAYRQGHDTCQGDSGGPMTIKENGKFVVIGVTSSGQGCGARGYAGIYTRVSHFHDWIKENVRDVCTPQTVSPIYITPPNGKPFTTPSTQSGTCPWLSSTSYDNIMQCGDGSSCSVISQGWGCCTNHQGRAKCPKSDPFMCARKRCAGNSQHCCGKNRNTCNGNYGGLRPCGNTPQFTTEQPSTTGCSCSDFVNRNGFGLCKKQDSDFGGLVSCYVKLQSTCTDLVQSGSNPGKYLSAKACVTKPAPYTPPSSYSTSTASYTPQTYGPSVTVRCGSCQNWDSRWCTPGEIQLAETCGKCPTEHGWFYCGGEFNDCRITGQGRYRNCQKMGNFKQLDVN